MVNLSESTKNETNCSVNPSKKNLIVCTEVLWGICGFERL
jgi:hypothetical protein